MKVSDMNVEDEYIVVNKDESVQDVARKLMKGNFGTAIVISEDSVLGALTVDIMVQKIVVEVKNPIETKVADIMDKNIVMVRKETDISEVAAEIRKKQPSAVVVTDDSGKKVIGYVSPMDMIEALKYRR